MTLAVALASTAAAAVEWKEVARHTLGGAGGWDLLAVDAASRRAFITRGDHLMIVDLDNGKVVGDVPGLKRAHGVTLVPASQRGYVTSGGDNRVVVFDLVTFKHVADIPLTGSNADAVVYDETSKHLFVFNGHSNDVSVVDTETNKELSKIPLPGKPELGVDDGEGHVFVNLEDMGQIARIDVAAGKVTATWPLGTCKEPTGLAIDPTHHRLFSVCANKQMAVVDSTNGHVVATLPIGDGPDGDAFDAATGTVFSSNSDGTLTLVHEDDADHFRVAATVATPPRSRNIAIDEKTHHAILPTAEFGAAPAPTAAEPHPKPVMKADSFAILIVGE